MASGVKVKDECQTTYLELQAGHKHRYIIFTLSDDQSEIAVKEKQPKSARAGGDPREEFEEFAQVLKTQYRCAYAVYDAEYYVKGTKREKVLFILWCNDNEAHIKEKMVYSSSKQALTRNLTGIQADIEAHDAEDLAWDDVMQKMEKFKR